MSTLKKFDRPICFQRIFVELTGTITGALFLSQAVYWQNRCSSEDGWWWKTQEDWTEETGMTRHELVSAKEATKKFIRHKLGGVPCRSFWKVDADALDACVQLVESSSPESGELDSRKAANKSAEKRRTTKDSKTSAEKSASAPPPSTKNGNNVVPPSREFSDGWCVAFKLKHQGTDYDYRAKCGVAVDRLLKKGVQPGELLATAIKAWSQTDPKAFWNCVNLSHDVAQFCGAYTKIKLELVKLNVGSNVSAGGVNKSTGERVFMP